ncbi:MAG: hypothetical protein KGJ87_08845 [Planctomycetota bacterium]|nr:hypothetical protein [Planctomycetota bacterium]MDE2217248.1 hypothetical protein [Planctomycetota bacterium]
MTKELPQLDLFSEEEHKKVLIDNFVKGLEICLSDLKYAYNQTLCGNVEEGVSEKALNHIREVQISVCKLMVVFGINHKIYKERNFIWYWNNYIDTYSNWTRNPLSQQELYETVNYLFNHFVMLFARHQQVWKPFYVKYVKDIEDNLKLAKLALK